MFWQIVSFSFPADRDADRRKFEAELSQLPTAIPDLAFVRVARDAEQAAVTGYISVFNDRNGFHRYLDHPAHQPIAQTADTLCTRVDRLLMTTNDDISIYADRPVS